MKHLLRNETGAAIIEFALAAPILFMMIFGISQIGIVFSANAGLQHAVAEGARVAAVFPTPGEDEIKAAITDSRFGLNPERLSEPTIEHGEDVDGRPYFDIGLTYQAPLNFVFFSPTVAISESRRVYLTVDSAEDSAEEGSTSTGGEGSI